MFGSETVIVADVDNAQDHRASRLLLADPHPPAAFRKEPAAVRAVDVVHDNRCAQEQRVVEFGDAFRRE